MYHYGDMYAIIGRYGFSYCWDMKPIFFMVWDTWTNTKGARHEGISLNFLLAQKGNQKLGKFSCL